VEQDKQRQNSTVDLLNKPQPIEKLTKEEILSNRARELALLSKDDSGQVEDSISVIEFLLGTESYAFETEEIREVHPLKDVTPIMCTPGFIVGVINIRGQVVTVLDLKKLLNFQGDSLTVFNKVIVIENDQMSVGLLADEVIGSQVVLRADIDTSSTLLGNSASKYLTGVTKDRLIILSADAILSDKRIIVNEEA
jgi:purine-binding chemotaxis protein CheW